MQGSLIFSLRSLAQGPSAYNLIDFFATPIHSGRHFSVNTKPLKLPRPDPGALFRINVVGSSGAGKSTFSRQLAAVLDIPYIEMDALYWLPDWTEPPDDVFFPLLEEALQGEAWVLDGNYSRTTAIKWRRVQTVIWLDFSLPRTLLQAFFRAARRSWTREELWPGTGNRESFRKSFLSRDSVLWWTITSFGRKRKRYAALMDGVRYPQIAFVRLDSPRQCRAFLAQLDGQRR